jgi:hypothetical protein
LEAPSGLEPLNKGFSEEAATANASNISKMYIMYLLLSFL